MFAHLHRLSPSFFDHHQLGDPLARLTGDVGAIESLMLSGINQALTYSSQILFFCGHRSCPVPPPLQAQPR